METTSNNQDIYDKLLAEAKTLTDTHKLRLADRKSVV